MKEATEEEINSMFWLSNIFKMVAETLKEKKEAQRTQTGEPKPFEKDKPQAADWM